MIATMISLLKELLPYAFSIFTFYIVLNSLMNKFSILASLNMSDSMPYVCGNLGYVINLSGKKGIGKTTTAAGIVNNLIIYIQMLMSRRMENIRKSLNVVDFDYFEKSFIRYLEAFKYDHIKASDVVISNYTFHTSYTDSLTIFDKSKMLQEYLDYYYILNVRKYYTLSKTYFFDCVNLQNSKALDSTSLELRRVEERRNYQLNIGQIIFDDEKSLDSGNVHSNSKDIKLSGKKEHRALLRNAYEGLCYEVTTKQYDSDEVKLERKQIDASINIRSRKVIDYKSPIVSILKFIYSACMLPFKLIYLFNDEKFIALKKRPGKLRNLEKLIDDLEKIISAEGFIKVYARLYFDPDDVGKQNKDLYKQIKLVFPKVYCYGSVDTYEWKAIRKYYEKFNDNSVETISSMLDENSKVELWKKALERGIK